MSYHKVLINMLELSDLLNLQATIDPKVIVEIGSLHGKDMKILSDIYKSAKVHIIEAHPVFAEKIKQSFPEFNIYNYAVNDKNEKIIFNGVDDGIGNPGISSVLERKNVNYTKYEVDGIRMDKFLGITNLSEIDILKIDVEGLSYEVLESFGEKIKNVKCIHIENEHIPIWIGQKTYSEVEKLLINSGFILLSIKSAWPQTDSVWIYHRFYNNRWWRD